MVRNAVRILGDTRTEQAIAFLHKVADHKDVRIRQEVINALINIGGRKAAGILARYLKDKDQGLQARGASRTSASSRGWVTPRRAT